MTKKELFYSFVGYDDYRPTMMHPFEVEGNVYATDAHIMLWAAKDVIDFEIPEPKGNVPNVIGVIPKQTLNVPMNIDWSFMDKLEMVDEIIEHECEECDGFGSVDYIYEAKDGRDHERQYDCPICDGSGVGRIEKTGRKVLKEMLVVEVKHGDVSVWFYLSILKSLKILQDFTNEPLTLLSLTHENKPIYVQIGAYKLICMPIMKQDDKPIHTITI